MLLALIGIPASLLWGLLVSNQALRWWNRPPDPRKPKETS